MPKLILKSVPAAIALAAALVLSTGGAVASGGAAAHRGSDTTPPDAFLRARKRQDLDYVFRKGIQATCGTSDDEQPLTCRMSATRKGRVLAEDVGTFDRPYNRYHFNLHLSAADRRKIGRATPPVEIKLKLRATDEAGNATTVTKEIRIVEDLWG